MPGSDVFLPHQFDRSSRIIGYEVGADCPAEVAFQTDERAVHGGGLLSLGRLEIRAVVGERWSGDSLHVKIPPLQIIACSFGLACFVPCDEMANIAQIVPHRGRSEIFLRTYGLFIQS